MEIIVTTGAIDGHGLGDIAEYPDELATKLVSRGFAAPAQAGGAKPKPRPKARAKAKARAEEPDPGSDPDEPPALSAEVPR